MLFDLLENVERLERNNKHNIWRDTKKVFYRDKCQYKTENIRLENVDSG